MRVRPARILANAATTTGEGLVKRSASAGARERLGEWRRGEAAAVTPCGAMSCAAAPCARGFGTGERGTGSSTVPTVAQAGFVPRFTKGSHTLVTGERMGIISGGWVERGQFLRQLL